MLVYTHYFNSILLITITFPKGELKQKEEKHKVYELQGKRIKQNTYTHVCVCVTLYYIY